MVKKCAALLKVQLLTFWNINKVIHSHDPKEKKRMTFFVFMMAIVSVMLCTNIGAGAYGYALLGFHTTLPELMLVSTSMMLMISGFMYGGSLLIGAKDYDMVMSMPITVNTVILSRFLTVYIYDLALTFGIMIPTLIVYSIFASPSLWFYIVYIVAIFFLPLLPMTVAMTIGILISLISSKFKYTNVITILFSIIFILAVIGISFNPGNANSEFFIKLFDSISNKIYMIYPPSYLFATALKGNILMFILYILVSAAGILLFIGLFSRIYKIINNLYQAHEANGNYKLGHLNSGSAFKALYTKEIKRYFSSVLYVMNTLIGAILLVIFACVLLFMSPSELESSMNIGGLSENISKMIPFIASIIVGLCCTTASSISLEGKNKWILLSAPIKSKTIFWSKIAVNLTITLPAILISGILFAITLKLTPAEVIFVFITPAVYSIVVSEMGLLINLKYPIYDWTNETAVIKQSVSVLLSMLFGMIPALAAAYVTIMFFSSNYLISLTGFTLIYAIFAVLLVIVIKNKKLS